MAVTYVIQFSVVPEQTPRFLALLQDVLDRMRAEETFREAVLHRSSEDPARFMLYETWADHQDVLDVQIHRPYRQAFHDALPEVLAAPRDISIWEPFRANRRTSNDTPSAL